MNRIFRIVFSKIIGLMIFLFMLLIVNSVDLNNHVYRIVAEFFNYNAAFIIFMSISFMVVEILFAIPFPFNLVAPIFSAFASIILVTFLARIFEMVDSITMARIFYFFSPLMFLIYPLVFVAVLIGGYISIFSRLVTKKVKKEIKTEKETKKGIKKKKDKSWEEVGDGFKKAFSDFFRKLADSIDKKE
ncbi:MAG: hypothetical protein KKF44_07945 [Nanoarchaeota archaeon]|nr:hypothetical protein [Nanoarchaeota archaeon]